MKNIPFKFRGRDVATDEIVYAELGDIIRGDTDQYIFFNNGRPDFLVDADSVALLVGFDKNGNEIYEGDIVVDNAGHEYRAGRNNHICAYDDGVSHVYFPSQFFTLKEKLQTF